MLTYGSVCSGIEAASVAWHPLGWRAAWLAEIEPFPSAVLAHRYPDVPNLGDMRELVFLLRVGAIDAPQLLTGGTPCQAFSVAGLRRSLDDARGNLSLTFCEIANEIDRVRVADGDEPCVIVWENVPGVLSTKDNAFGCFLAGLAGEDDPLEPPGGKWPDAGYVLGPQRAIAWRVLDAQYFGLAQRRRRVVLVASARKGFDPAQVLFEWQGVRRDSAPSRQAGEGTAAATAPSLTASGRGVERTGEFRGQDPVVAVAPTLTAQGNTTGGDRPPGTTVGTATSLVLAFGGGQNCAQTDVSTALHGHPGGSRLDFLTETFVAHSLRGEGFDVSEDGTGRGTPLVPVQPALYSIMPMNSGRDYKAREVEVAQPLMAGGPVTGNQGGDVIVQPLPFDTTQVTSAMNRSNPQPGDPCHPHAPAIAIQAGATRENPESGPDGVGVSTEGVAYTLEARAEVQAVQSAMQVRRLTPVECARLQGFPDDYLDITFRGKPAADGPKYRALGNSWAVPKFRWVGQRIHEALMEDLV